MLVPSAPNLANSPTYLKNSLTSEGYFPVHSRPRKSRLLVPAGSCWLHVFLSSMSLLSADVILRAADRIKPFVRRTPLEISYWLSEAGNARVYVKLGECHDLISKAFGCDHRRLGEFRSSLVREFRECKYIVNKLVN